MVIQRYVAIGDSTTEGVGDELPDGSLRGWADRFAAALSLRYGQISYANLAVRGRLTAQIREEQAAPALALTPDLITAVVGVNDLVASEFDPAAFDQDVGTLFAMLRTGGAIVLSSTLPDLSGLVPLPRPVRRALQRRHAALNDILERRAADHGVRILPLADLPGAADPKVWQPDRLHPNPVGHALLAEAMLQLLDDEPITVVAEEQRGYGATTYARPGVVGASSWAGRYLLPRTIRRARGRSSGDGRVAKLPSYIEVRGGPVAEHRVAPAGDDTRGAPGDAEALHEQPQRVALSAGVLEYRVAGEGPVVLFLHPLLASGLHWRKVVPIVAAAGYRCVVPTLPLGAHRIAMRAGADLSPPAIARLAVELVEKLDLGSVTVVGNDTGGALAQMMAASRPDVVDRLVLTSCDALEHFFPPLFRYLRWGADIPGFVWVLRQAMRIRPLRRLPIAFGRLIRGELPHEVIDSYAAALRNRAVRRDLARFLRGVSSRDTCAAAEMLRSFDRPALIAWAAQDKVFAPALARRLAELLPQSTLRWVDSSYGFTPEDQPALLAREIIAFCDATGGNPAR